MSVGFVVTERIEGAHPKHTSYPLLPGDLLVASLDGSWWKECPGIAVGGFVLTDEQVATLREVEFHRNGLQYILEG